jgi:hypothetical protein
LLLIVSVLVVVTPTREPPKFMRYGSSQPSGVQT